MKTKALCFVFGSALVFANARAITLAEHTTGMSETGLTYRGQSFTTIAGSSTSNITLNFFSDKGPATTPYALGTGFLYSLEYLGTPGALGTGLGFLGQADAAGGFYTFDASVILLPSTQYFFYENVVLPDLAITLGGTHPGGVIYNSVAGNFMPSPNGISANFRVTGTPVGVPEGGSSPLLLGLSITLLVHRALGRRLFA